jgi:hypothetical protein
MQMESRLLQASLRPNCVIAQVTSAQTPQAKWSVESLQQSQTLTNEFKEGESLMRHLDESQALPRRCGVIASS